MFRRLLPLAAILATFCLCSSQAQLSRPATQGIREALSYSKKGQQGKALALLESLLLTQPVRVAIDERTVPKGAGDYARSVQRGVQAWRAAMPEAPFRVAQDRERAEVVVRFVPHIDVPEDVQGMIEARRDLHWDRRGQGYRLKATLLVREETDGRLLTENEVTSVVAHELGHILGLDDTPRPRELMGPFVPGRAPLRPTDDEIALVREYRAQVRDTMARVRDSR